MSNVVFMVGNGFDLGCGLKSSYQDFYKVYCQEDKTDSENITKFKKELKENHKKWADFEKEMASYSKSFSSESDYYECIRDFRKKLKLYLQNEEEKILNFANNDNELRQKIHDETNNSIRNFYKNISPNITNIVESKKIERIDFISFNYTCLLDNFVSTFYPHAPYTSNIWLYEFQYNHPNVTHIHGSLKNNDIVLGIDREEQLEAIFELTDKGRRTFIKPFYNQIYDKQRIDYAEHLIFSAEIVCIFGLELGISDLCWRENLISWLQSSSNNHLFIYDYELFSKSDLDFDEECDEEDARKNKLFIDWNITKPEKISPRIHIPCGKHIFNYSEIINKSKQTNEK